MLMVRRESHDSLTESMNKPALMLSPEILNTTLKLSDASVSDSLYAEYVHRLFSETGSAYGIGRISLYSVEAFPQPNVLADAAEQPEESQKEPSDVCFSQLYSWKHPDIFNSRNEDAQQIPFHPYYTRWLEVLQRGERIIGDTGSFPKIEQELLTALNTVSTFIIPDIWEGRLQGFLAFDRLTTQPEPFSEEIQQRLEWLVSSLFSSYHNRLSLAAKQKKIDSLGTQLQSKNQILANLSHEIRTPMNGIVGLAEQLEDLENDLSKRSFLENIKLSAANLMEVLSGIAEFSKSDESNDNVSEDRVGLKSEILPITKLYEEKAAEKNLTLTTTFDENLPAEFIGDYHKIRNVLKNLIDNAIKFTKDGYVKVRFSYLEQEQDPRLVIDVEDSGIGISKDKQTYVFEKYAQIEQGFTRSYSGIGLGLSIVKNTLMLLKGDIELESEAGKGSLFRVGIPIKLLQPEQDQHLSLEPETLRKLRILVVDDHPINRKVVTTILDKWSSTYEVAKNGLEAVQMTQKANFDIILMDIQMPVMDGYDATREIRRLKGNSTIILALTASILKEDEKHCIEVGMDGIIRKPFFPDNLRYWVYKQNTHSRPSQEVAFSPEDQSPVSSTHLNTHSMNEHKTQKSEPDHINLKESGTNMAENSERKTVTDLAYLKDISDGNVEFMDEMVNLFIDQSSGHIESLQEGISSQNYETIAAAAHKMKPVLGYVGINAEYSKIRDIETQAKQNGDLNHIQQLLDELQAVITQANEELKAFLASH